MSGVDLKTVQELLGHKSIEMTMRYSHLSASHKKRAVDRLAFQMDTIWIPEALTRRDHTNNFGEHLAIKQVTPSAHVAQLVEQSIRNA